MTTAIAHANASTSDREVVIPAGQAFIMMPVIASNIKDITFRVDGTVYASQDY